MSSDLVRADRHSGYLTLTLNRPDKLNAFNDGQLTALRNALEVAAVDESCRAVLLTGAGRGFCAGQDLGDRDPSKMMGPPDLGATLESFYNPLIRLIRGLGKPVVAAVNGVAAGAGANVALACDIVIAARSAKFIQPFCKLGLVPDCGGTWTLTRLLGEARAKALAMTGAAITAEEAASWGMIWRVVDDEALMDEAHALMAAFAEAPTIGLALTKQAIHAANTNDLDSQLDLERDLQRRAGRTPDYAEGVAAFLGKRAPNFTGREDAS